MPEKDIGTMLQAMIGLTGPRNFTIEEYIGAIKTETPEQRTRSLDQLIRAAKTDQTQRALYNLNALTATESNLGDFNFGISKRLQEPWSLSHYVGLFRNLSIASSIQGYGGYLETQRAFGSNVSPDALKTIPIYGIHDLPIYVWENSDFKNERGEPIKYRKRSSLSYSLAEILGFMAYRQRMTDLYIAKAGDSHDSVLVEFVNDFLAKKVGIEIEAKANETKEQRVNRVKKELDDKIAYVDFIDQNGKVIDNYDKLRDFIMVDFTGAEDFTNTFMDVITFSQSVNGGLNQEYARSQYVKYFDKYKQIPIQMLPESDLVPLFGGLLSRYADRGGFKYIFDELKKSGSSEREKVIRDILTFSPKVGKADIVEADFVINKLGQNVDGSRAEDLLLMVNRIPSFNATQLNSPDLWVSRARHWEEFYQRGGVDLWRDYDFSNLTKLAMENSGMQESAIREKLRGLTGHDNNGLRGNSGFRKYIKFLSEMGVAAFDWSNFATNDGNNIFRYGEKVKASTGALVGVASALNGGTGTLSEEQRRYIGKSKQINEYDRYNDSVVKGTISQFDQIAKGEFLKFCDPDDIPIFMRAYAEGIIRMHATPDISDTEFKFIDIDWKSFTESKGATVTSRPITKKELYKRKGYVWYDEVEKKDQYDWEAITRFEKELARAGCRWVAEKDKGETLIGSSGRTLYFTTDTKTQYQTMGGSLVSIARDILKSENIPVSNGEGLSSLYDKLKNRIEHSLQTESVEVVSKVADIIKEYLAVSDNGYNRFNFDWILGHIKYSAHNLMEIVEELENNKFIRAADKQYLNTLIEQLKRNKILGTTGRWWNTRSTTSLPPPSSMRKGQVRPHTPIVS